MDEAHLRAVLDRIGLNVQNVIEGELVIFCPFHFNTRTPSGEIEIATGQFYCFSCNATASLEELVMKVTGCSVYESMRMVRSDKSNVDIITTMEKSLTNSGPKFEPYDQHVVTRLHNDCVTTPRAVKYWTKRGLSLASIDKFELGYSQTQGMVTTPLHTSKGILMGFQGRTIEGKRFQNSTGLKKSRTLFNLHRVRAKREIVIVESPIDVMLLDQVGVPAIASMGATMSKTQIELLTSYFNNVIVIPDADKAGEEMVTKLRVTYQKGLTVIKLPPDVKDIGELTKEQLEYLASKVADPLLGLSI